MSNVESSEQRLYLSQRLLRRTIYNASSEYAKIKAAGQQGWTDGGKVILETLLSIKRAGADLILT